MRKRAKLLCVLCLFIMVGLVAFAAGSKEGAGKGLVFYLSPNQFDEFQTTASKLIRKYVEDAGYELKEMVAQSGQAEDVALHVGTMM